MPHRSGVTSGNWLLFSGFACERRDAVRTNCPTELAKLFSQSIVSIRILTGEKHVPRKECVEGIVCDKYAVQELHNASEHDKD